MPLAEAAALSVLGLEAVSLGGLAINVVSGFCTDLCKKKINEWLRYRNHDVPRCLREAWTLTLQDVSKEAIAATDNKLSTSAIEQIRKAVKDLTTKEACEQLFPADLTYVGRELLGMPGHDDPALIARISNQLVQAFEQTHQAQLPLRPALPEPFLAHMRASIFRPFSRYFIEVAFKHDEAARAELELLLERWHTELLLSIDEKATNIKGMVADLHRDRFGPGGGGGGSAPTTNFALAGRTRNVTFVGREKELGELHAALTGGTAGARHTAAITQAFTGEGGIGKSQLAQRYAEVHADDWHGRWWIDCAQTAADGEGGGVRPSLAVHRRALEGMAQALHIPLPREQAIEGDTGGEASRRAWFADARGAIRAALSDGRRHLVILDNVERSAEPGDPWNVVRELTPEAPACVIVTTRDRSLPDNLAVKVPLDVLLPEDARKLLMKRFVPRQEKEGKSLPGWPAADLDELADFLSRHALAVDLAAAELYRTPTLTPKKLLAKLKASDEAALGFFDDDDVSVQAHGYRLSVARSLLLHAEALGEGSNAMKLLRAAAYAAPRDIPMTLLTAAAGVDEDDAPAALKSLAERSIVEWETLGDLVHVSLHRLTQTAVRARLVARAAAEVTAESGEAPGAAGAEKGGGGAAAVLGGWLTALINLFGNGEWVQPLAAPRTAACTHVNFVVGFAERSVPEIAARVAQLRASVAVHLNQLGQLSSAMGHVQAAIEWGELQKPRDERSLAIDYASRASIRQDRGDLKGAEEDIARSIDWSEKQTPRDERSLAIDYASRAGIRLDRGDLKAAEEDIARSIDWGEQQTPRDERGLAIWYASRAGIRQDRGDLKGAEEDIARSIAWGEQQTPRDERSLAIRYALRATIRELLGDLKGAEGDIARSIEWGEAQAPRDEHSLAIWLASRASIRQLRGDLNGAELDIARSIDWAEKQTPRDERSLAIDYATRANIRRLCGDLKGAEEDIARGIEWGEKQTPRDERSLAIRYGFRARIRAAQAEAAWTTGRRDEAARLFDQARADIKAALDWWLANLPGDQRTIGFMREDAARIEAAARGD